MSKRKREELQGFAGAELMEACLANNLAKVTQILEAGVPVDYPDKDGWSPLMYALLNRRDSMATLL